MDNLSIEDTETVINALHAEAERLGNLFCFDEANELERIATTLQVGVDAAHQAG
jgi:hypothetical protein